MPNELLQPLDHAPHLAHLCLGIVRALHEYAERLRAGNFRIYVRRAGPNYQEGLQLMRQTGAAIGVPIAVHGPETHITAIVPMAIEYLSLKNTSGAAQEITLDKNDFISTVISKASAEKDGKEDGKKDAKKDAKPFALPQDQSVAREPFSLFSAASRAFCQSLPSGAATGSGRHSRGAANTVERNRLWYLGKTILQRHEFTRRHWST